MLPIILACALLAQIEAKDRCVLVTAEVRKSPPQIELRWPADPKATGYTIFRKEPSASSWGEPRASFGAPETRYVDSDVESGVAYEYKVQKAAQAGDKTFKGTGYLLAGIELPLRDRRGKVILIIDAAHAGPLAEPLERLERDLRGDGWTVLRRDVAPGAKPPEVKNLIRQEYQADRENLRTVFLFGHVAVPYSGDFNPDGHPDHRGAWPADAYYGDMDEEWPDATIDSPKASRPENRNVPGDGKFDPTFLPHDVALDVGRVDLSRMPAFGKSEAELLRRYLDKDHAYRHGRLEAERRGLICDKFGDFRGEAFSASGWRNFAPLVGDATLRAADWFTSLGEGSYLVAQGSGAGGFQSCAGVGSTGDFAAKPTKAVFTMLFGSYFGDWDSPDNLLRAPLAAESHGLAAMWAGRPHWFLHPMGLGETIGRATRLTQNNQGLYSPTGSFRHAIHIALMGDPTLRLHRVTPPSDLKIVRDGAALRLEWKPSPDAEVSYHVYHAPDAKGSFERLTAAPIRETSYAPAAAKPGLYMVRAVHLEVSPSGSYVNASQGLFAP
jgi:hypothetical protein